jgi:DNA-binding response OmpR family regulator
MEARTAVVVEDEADIRDLVALILAGAGFTVHSFANGTDGVDAARRLLPDLVTVDLGLPDIDGFEVVRRVREFSDAYIVMLTARTQEVDTVLGLESGADEYMTKPFVPRELCRRVEAVMRRPRTVHGVRAAPLAPGLGERRALEHNGLCLMPASRRAVLAGREVPLTRTEFDLLYLLMEGGRKVRTRAEIIALLPGPVDGEAGYSREGRVSVQFHIRNLRAKLGESRLEPQWVETARGVGYRMTRPQLP